MKNVLKMNVICTIIWLCIFIVGIYTVTFVQPVTMGDALHAMQTDTADMQEITVTMMNLSQQQILTGSVITLVGGMGVIVCMHWWFVLLKNVRYSSK